MGSEKEWVWSKATKGSSKKRKKSQQKKVRERVSMVETMTGIWGGEGIKFSFPHVKIEEIIPPCSVVEESK